MDRELAGAVFDRWNTGYPVSEAMLFKAASVMGVDPYEALTEARFYTYLDQCLLEKRAMSIGERIVFSAAAGIEPGRMEKTASAHGFSPDELIIEALRERGFRPDLEKIANLSAVPGGDPMAGGAAQDPYEAMAAQAGQAMAAPPQPGAQVQQQPIARFKPSPTAPEQAVASPEGNLQSLLQEQQAQYQDPGMEANGGQPPAAGMPQPAPPPPSPEERIQQVGPNLDPETVARYSEQLVRFEEGIQMPINDPKQMVKFVKELQKVDGKRIDQGIKAMGQQLEQEQAQELGVDGGTPTIDGPGGGAGQGVMAGPPGGASAPSPQGGPGAAQSPGGGGEEGLPAQEGAGPQKPQQKPPAKPAPQQAAPAAVEKVANAARALARASLL